MGNLIFQTKFLIILFELINLYTGNNNVYKIPFGLFNRKNSNDSSLDIAHNIYYSSIYVNLSIGTPPQIIPFALKFNSQTFSVPFNLFNRNKSLSYESNSKNEIYYEYEDVTDGYNSKDKLNFNNNTNQKINFILGTKYEIENNDLGTIGLRIPKRVQFGVYPFFHSLKIARIINSYSWTLKYFDNISLIDTVYYNKEKNNGIIGEFIIGDEPANYENDNVKYNKNEFYKVSPLTSKKFINWDIEFNSIYFLLKGTDNEINSKINIQENKKAEIIPEFGFMIAPNNFFESIKNNFFQKYLRQNICFEKKINIYYYNYIECNYTSQFKVSSFPNIGFEHIGFETIFNFTYKDLFIVDKINRKYIFLIFNKEYYPNWVLGGIFLRKYQFVFNEDLKTIGYYKANNNYYNNDNNKDSINHKINKDGFFKYILIVILIIFLSFLLIIIGMFCQKNLFNKNRKIRANELEDNFSYDSRLNSNKNKGNNKNKRIFKKEDDKKYYSI